MMEAQDSEVINASTLPIIPMQPSDNGHSSMPSVASPNQTSDVAKSATRPQRFSELQDATLRFFANASNETLGACAVGLCASTYLILGRVGLVLIGAVGGVVLHATWEQNQHSGEDDTGHIEAAKRRREQSFELAKRALDWRDRHHAVNGLEARDKIETSTLTKELDYTGFRPETKQALTEFTDAVVRDYVKWWYSPILPTENAFPVSCRQILTGFLLSFSRHVSRRRTEDPFLDFIANSTSIIIIFLNELGTAIKASPNQEVAAAITTYLDHQPESNLANVLSPEQQQRKLHLVADDVLQTFLDSKTYNCAPAQVFLREVLATLILQATIKSCSKAEWINGWIVYLLEDGEPEIMNVIDAGVEKLSDKMASSSSTSATSSEDKKHQRRVSRAEEAMQEAMREAQRLNEMIAEDDARRKREGQTPETEIETETMASVTTTDTGIPTPTSSDSDLMPATTEPVNDSMIFDADGNHVPTGTNTPADSTSPVRQKQKPFTSFDDLAPVTIPTALQPETNPPPRTETMSAVPLTLHNASITLLDLGEGNDRAPLKQKPSDEFLVQIEPASSRFPGWMVTRKYPDFEPLHETLRRIATVSGVPEFNVQNATVPAWKGQTRLSLIGLLEVYLRQALKHERLAESEAMKKFLDKDVGLHKVPTANKNVLLQGAAALDNVGKGFINVLGQGGKGIAGGGKAVLGGVQGVFGAVGSAVGGPKRPMGPSRLHTNEFVQTPSGSSTTLNSGRPSLDFVSTTDTLDQMPSPLPPRTSTTSIERMSTPPRVPALQSDEILNLPPTPSEITEEFVPTAHQSGYSHKSTRSVDSKSSRPVTPTPASRSTVFQSPTDTQPEQSSALPTPTDVMAEVDVSTEMDSRPQKQHAPLTDEETRITVDLIFAIITSTYSLSSAWTFRLSLLSAAKTFLLRPNNPQLESIRSLLQESLIENNTTDAAIAGHVRKLRENTLPTAEELATWPAEASSEEKEKLRIKARKLLVERGMPQALTSVMGQAASGEALGKVFDCLQVEAVAQGLIFAIVLQAMRAVMQ